MLTAKSAKHGDGKNGINWDLCQTKVDPLCCVLLYLWDGSDGFHLVGPL